jgi:hypothetical protein
MWEFQLLKATATLIRVAHAEWPFFCVAFRHD